MAGLNLVVKAKRHVMRDDASLESDTGMRAAIFEMIHRTVDSSLVSFRRPKTDHPFNANFAPVIKKLFPQFYKER